MRGDSYKRLRLARPRLLYFVEMEISSLRSRNCRNYEKIINFNYIGLLYYYLYTMSDEGLDDFCINEKSYLERLYGEMRAEFDKFGPISQGRALDVLEYVLVTHSWVENWRGLSPQEIPLDEVEDKRGFVHALFVALSGREPNPSFDLTDVEVDNYVGPTGINTRI
ncbi:hypothetical protein [Burkholderia stagnalis]|uniref:hypothetical protein n=1 Tax=Burkholderia stagnalis TaxID=1503054 RepID=UPI0012D95484|nr:hypothetical protein [Burkholderia stagnalis]